MPKLKLYLFGAPHFERDGMLLDIDRRKALAMSAFLAMCERPPTRDKLATILWPDLDQERARAALRSTLPTLTTLVEEPWIVADRSTIAFNPEYVWIDVQEFLAQLAEVRAHNHSKDGLCDECAQRLQDAVALFTDDFLAGFTLNDSLEFDDWQSIQREWLRRECGGALRRLAVHNGAQGDYDPAIEYGHRWLALDVLHEPAHRLLMRLYAVAGQRNEALRQYQDCVRILDQELATPPEDETTQLYEELRRSTGTLTPGKGQASGRPHVSVMPPLPSLVVGREDVLSDLKARIGIPEPESKQSVTVIQGWPGVGKSTTVAALAHDLDVAQAYPDGILWASLGEKPNLLGELMTWTEALHLVSPDKTPRLEDLTSQLNTVLHDKRMLLIVDDVWAVAHVAPFRVGGQDCALVMTSRMNDVARALASAGGDVYRMPVLPEDNALLLLERLAPHTVKAHRESARELVRSLEGLPLAIQVAGRLLYQEMRMGWGIADLLAELRDGAGLLSAQAPGDMSGAERDILPTVAALLQRSTDALDDEARTRFALLGLFVPKPATFDLQAMAAAWEVDDPKPTARQLVNRGLLEPVSGGRFQMHALLVLHARSLLTSTA
ncbi:MAG: hypothetical protein IH587_06490 [Anaerolineae bacterium]|nr:hypothetical protein [Anaerolineae bacterium]